MNSTYAEARAAEEAAREAAKAPTDEAVIAWVKEREPVRFKKICEGLGIRQLQPGSWKYTDEAEALARQLQRLRKQGFLRSGNDQRWRVK